MNKGLFSTILLTVFLIVCNCNQVLAQAKGKQINFIETEISLEQQAKNFIFKLNTFIDFDESQENSLIYLRFTYLTALKKLEGDPKMSFKDKKIEADIIQKEYDEQFSSIFTAEQKLELKKNEVPSK